MANTVAFVSPARFALDGESIRKWREESGIFIDGAQHSRAYQRKLVYCTPCQAKRTCRRDCSAPRAWDGKYYPGSWEPGNTGRLMCGRGLLQRVLSELQAYVTVIPPLPPYFDASPVEGFRDFQNEALKLIGDYRWLRIGLATNAGKGAVIALAAKRLVQSGCRTLILCDETAVFQALQKEVATWADVRIGIVNEDPWHFPPEEIVLAMIPSLYARVTESRGGALAKKKNRAGQWREWLLRFEAALLDEADKAAAPSWGEIMRLLDNTHYRVGFSGTFFDDGSPTEMAVREALGPVLLRKKNIEMIERGISARPIVNLYPYDQGHTLARRPRGKEWDDLGGNGQRHWMFQEGVAMNEHRHHKVLQLLEPNEPNAIVINYIEHGRQLANIIPNSSFLHGSDSKEVRIDVLEKFKRGDIQNLIVSKILDRGTNELGTAVGLIFASGQGSLRQTLQRIGRGLRRAGGKEFVFLKDILDRGHPFFDSPSRKRVALYAEEGFEATIHTL